MSKQYPNRIIKEMAARINAALEKLDLDLKDTESSILYPDGLSIADKNDIDWEKSNNEFHELMYRLGVWI